MSVEETLEHIVRRPVRRTRETPLFFQHGAWHAAWCWERFLDYFAGLGYEAHAISLPGHGTSAMNRGHINRYGIMDYVEVMAAEIARVTPPPVVVGHSMGGAMVQYYLESHTPPAAVLLASVPVHGMLPMTLRSIARYPWKMAQVALRQNYYYFVHTPAMARAQFLGAGTDMDIGAFHARLDRETAHFGTALRLHFAPAFRSERVRAPVLVVAGDADALFSIEEERRTAEALGAEFLIFAEQAHDLMLEPAWQDIAAALDRWLTEDLNLP